MTKLSRRSSSSSSSSSSRLSRYLSLLLLAVWSLRPTNGLTSRPPSVPDPPPGGDAGSQAPQLARQVAPHIAPDTVGSLDRLPFGNTNRVYRLSSAPSGQQFLVRSFGASAALAFDRARENEVGWSVAAL